MKYFSMFISIVSFSLGQWFYINHNGVNRAYYVSYPTNFSNEPSSLIINMHGYGGNALNQLGYTQMDEIANSQNIAIAYPQGLNNSWNVFTFWDSNTYDDVGFISYMIDDISQNFNIDSNKIYACGMSNGGYMAYRLACDLSNKITAFGSVTGNFMLSNSLNDCQSQDRDIPIIHFHGTSDAIVDYFPPSFDGSLTVEESIQFWSNYNNLDLQILEQLNSNVEVYTYYSESTPAKFVHYKVIGGGHDWFGSPWVTNWGFDTSAELINFFTQYSLTDFINNQLIGDLNEDLMINIQDIIIIINFVLNNDYIESGDINLDGIINILDIVQIVDIILNQND